MAQIFLSYSHLDENKARSVASALELEGWTVWWDPKVRAGESFVSLINREIYAADCVVVLWSKASVNSRWVQEEAHNALNRDILCAAMIEHDAQLPVGFATVKYTPLWEWHDERPLSKDLKALFENVERLIGAAEPKAIDAVPEKAESPEPITVKKTEAPEPVTAEKTEAPEPVTAEKAEAPEPITAEKAEAPEPITVSQPAAGTEHREEPTGDDTDETRQMTKPTAASPPKRISPSKFRSAARQYLDFSEISPIDYPFIFAFFCGIAIIFFDVILRYFFGLPTLLSEISAPLIGVTALFGAAIAEKHSRNIKSPIALFIFGEAYRRRLNSFGSFFSALIFTGFLFVFAADLLENYAVYVDELSMGMLQYPRIILRFSIFAVFLLLTIYSARNLVNSLKNRAHP
jgi:TRAP-type C4-dicarboxylate transport system permease small subunit